MPLFSCLCASDAADSNAPAAAATSTELAEATPQQEVQIETETEVAVEQKDEAVPAEDVPAEQQEAVVAVEAEQPAEEQPVAAAEEQPAAAAEEAAVAEEQPAAAEEAAAVEAAAAAAVFTEPLDQEALGQLFTEAHTEHGFQDKKVERALLEKAVQLTLLAPTAYNCSPIRIVFVESAEGKEKLAEALMEGNRPQAAAAPVTAIVAVADDYTEELPTLMPFVPGVKDLFENTPGMKDFAKNLNGNLQGAYFLLALRSLGLGVGPMSGFDNAKVNELFLEGTQLKSVFLVNIGYGDESKRYPRAPRLAVDVAAQWQ